MRISDIAQTKNSVDCRYIESCFDNTLNVIKYVCGQILIRFKVNISSHLIRLNNNDKN